MQAGDAVTHLPQAQAQPLCRQCAIEARFVQRPDQDAAFNGIQIRLQIRRGLLTLAARGEQLLRWGGSWGLLGRLECSGLGVGGVGVELEDIAVRECHGTVQHVFQLAHIALQGQGANLGQR